MKSKRKNTVKNMSNIKNFSWTQRMKKTADNIAQMAGGGLSSATEGVGVSSSGLNKIRQQVACDVKSYIKEVRLILPQEANCSCLESFEKYVVGGLL